MNRNHSACNDEQLLVLLRADEDSEEACPVVSHVQHCNGCQQRLEELAASADDWDEASELLAAHRLATADIGEQHANRWSARDFAARPVAFSRPPVELLNSSGIEAVRSN